MDWTYFFEFRPPHHKMIPSMIGIEHDRLIRIQENKRRLQELGLQEAAEHICRGDARHGKQQQQKGSRTVPALSTQHHDIRRSQRQAKKSEVILRP